MGGGLTVDQIKVLITAQTAGFQKEIDNVNKKLASLSSAANKATSSVSTKTIAMGTTIGSLFSKVISKAISTIASNVDYATKRLDTLNRFPIVLQNLGVSAEDSSNAIQTLANYTLELPTTLNDAAEKVQYFTSATNNVGQSIKIFEALNDAIVSGAQSADVQSTALYQWSQAIVRGSFDVEQEFNALVVANAKAVNEISEKLLGTGKDFNDLYAALKKGKVTINDVVNAMVDLDQNGVGSLESWSERARNSVAGIDTAITRLKTNIGKAVAVVAEEIGWRNIYTFINSVGDAIYKAGQYVAAFVRILKEAFAWVSALFGGSGATSGIVKSTSVAADGLNNVASGASNVAGGLSDANDQAKKLKKQLAGFDEMNVLSEDDSSSNSGGSAKIDVGDLEWDSRLEKTTDKIAQLAEKIKKALGNIFGDIDFSKLKKSFETFGSGAGKAINFLVHRGQRFVSEFIAPVTKFAIEDTLPRTFEAWGTALNNIDYSKIEDADTNVFRGLADVATQVLNAFAGLNEIIAPVWGWIQSFVVPPALNIFAFLLEGVSAIISGVNDAFVELFEMMRPAFEKLGNAVEPVLNLINDFFSSMSQDNDVMKLFHDIAKGVANFLLEVFGTILREIIDIVCGVIDVFNMVVEVIGTALVDIIKTWQEAPNFFAGIWGTIKAIFSGVINFFWGLFSKALETVIAVWSEVLVFFGNIWNGIKGVFSPVIEWFKGIFKKAWDKIKGIWDGVGQWFSDRWEDIKKVFDGAFDLFKDIGKNMWDGLKKGLGGMVEGVKNMFDGAVEGIKGLLGINSPSKVFAKIGGYVDEGFAIGVKTNFSDVERAMKGFSNLTISAPDIAMRHISAPNVSLPASSILRPTRLDIERSEPVAIQVNIGGDTLVDKVVDGINDRSFLSSKAVINI